MQIYIRACAKTRETILYNPLDISAQYPSSPFGASTRIPLRCLGYPCSFLSSDSCGLTKVLIIQLSGTLIYSMQKRAR